MRFALVGNKSVVQMVWQPELKFKALESSFEVLAPGEISAADRLESRLTGAG